MNRERTVALDMIMERDVLMANWAERIDVLLEDGDDEYFAEKVDALQKMTAIVRYERATLLELLARTLDYTEELA